MFGFKRNKNTPARDLTVGRTTVPDYQTYGGPTLGAYADALGTSTALKVTIQDGPEGFVSEYTYDDEDDFAASIADFGRLYGHKGTITITIDRV